MAPKLPRNPLGTSDNQNMFRGPDVTGSGLVGVSATMCGPIHSGAPQGSERGSAPEPL